MKLILKYFFVSTVFLLHGVLFADQNPFDIREDFQAIDKADNTLFSTMQNELDKAEVVPESVMIDFKKNTIIKHDINLTIPSPAKKQYTILPRKKNLDKTLNENVKKEKKIKLLNKEKIQYLENKKKRRKRKKIRILKKKNKVQSYYEKQIANIDLLKEKRIKQEKLDQKYRKAVEEVNTYNY